MISLFSFIDQIISKNIADAGNCATLTYRHTLLISVHFACAFVCIYMPDPLLHGEPANCPTHNGPFGHRIVTMQQIELLPLTIPACSNSNYPIPHIQLTQQRASIQNPFTLNSYSERALLFTESTTFHCDYIFLLKPKSKSVTTQFTIKAQGNVLLAVVSILGNFFLFSRKANLDTLTSIVHQDL